MGDNPLRWNCDDNGCFNDKCRPKIEVLSRQLQGKRAFMDIDATTEVGGRFLFIEFKSGKPRPLSTGQRLYYQRLTQASPYIKVIIVCADVATMECRHLCQIYKGVVGAWEDCDLPKLQARVKQWGDRAVLLKAPYCR